MDKINVILDNEMMPSGSFGAVAPGGDTRGVLQFTNESSVPGKLTIVGSNDSTHFGVLKKMRLASGRTKVVKLKTPQNLLFFNPGPAFGPCTLILKS